MAVLLGAFLTGALSMGLASKTGFMTKGGNVSHQLPRSSTASNVKLHPANSFSFVCSSAVPCQYVSSHWDRQTADAHHALDIILDNLKHPELYEEQHGVGMVKQARNTIGVSS